MVTSLPIGPGQILRQRSGGIELVLDHTPYGVRLQKFIGGMVTTSMFKRCDVAALRDSRHKNMFNFFEIKES